MRTNTHTHTVKRAKKRARARRCTLVLITTIITLMITTYIDTHYKRDAIVDSVVDGVVTLVDSSNNTWIVEDAENIFEGQEVILKMHTHNTNNIITDDTILNIKPKDIRMH